MSLPYLPPELMDLVLDQYDCLHMSPCRDAAALSAIGINTAWRRRFSHRVYDVAHILRAERLVGFIKQLPHPVRLLIGYNMVYQRYLRTRENDCAELVDLVCESLRDSADRKWTAAYCEKVFAPAFRCVADRSMLRRLYGVAEA